MNKAKTASAKARRLNRNGANNARPNGAPRKTRNPPGRAHLGSTTSDLADRNGTHAFQHSESRYQALFDLVPVAVYSIDASGVIENFNRRAVELWGREPVLGDTDQRFCGSFKMFRPDGSFMPHDHCPMAEVLSGKITSAHDAEVLIERPDGSRVTVLVNIRPLKNDRGEVIGAINCFYDVTARKKTEAELKKSKEMLEELVQQRTKALRVANTELENEITRRKGLEGQILEISDREQERLGQELHDGLCQQLTAIGFLARATALRLQNHRVVQTEDLEKIAQLINSSVMDARNIARDLHKEEIDAAEFPMALRALVERKIWKTPCRLELKTEVSIEDDKVASQLYRILREAVINANKHARATQIVLEVRRVKNELVFSVTDNGVGLGRKPKSSQGLGFHIMQYRAQSIGAHLEFQSRKKSGSRVACYLPLS
jgi:signal transduction histidine kinase